MPTLPDKAKALWSLPPKEDWITHWITATNWNWMDDDSKCLRSVNAEVDPDLALDPGPALVHAPEADLGLALDLAADPVPALNRAIAPSPDHALSLAIALAPDLNPGAVQDPAIVMETRRPTGTDPSPAAVLAPDPSPVPNPDQGPNPGTIDILDIPTEDRIITKK